MPRPKSNKESERLRRIVHEHLRRRASLAQVSPVGAHLDEDALNAFTEGRLSETESAPLIDAILEQFNMLWEGRRCDSCKRKDVCPVPLEEPAL